MLNIDAARCYVVRTRTCSAFPEIVGKILYVRSVGREGIVFSFTNNCVPDSAQYKLPPEINDDGWYDVTQLVLRANAMILPKMDTCAFCSDAASNYKNYLGLNPKPLSLSQAAGQICFLGNATTHGVAFLKQAYFVANYDRNGYILAYSGYCHPVQQGKNVKPQQRILNLNGTTRNLFAASEVVSACNRAYQEDCEKAVVMVSAIRERTAGSVTDTDAGSQIFNSGLNRMRLSSV